MSFLPWKRRRQASNQPDQQRPAGQRPEPHKYHAITINERRFLKEVAYVLPKDHEEVNRLDFQHYMLRQALKGNYLAPIEEGPLAAILDIGCGTGRWCKELALQFPAVQIYGLDLEESRSSTGPIPPNYHFLPGNVLERLPFEDEAFDFVHQRLLVAAIPASRWPEIIREQMRVTRPGGWIELVECGVEGINLGPLTQQFFSWGVQACASREIDARAVPTLGKQMQEEGINNVQETTIDIPIGPWGGHIGVMMQEDLLSAFGGLKTLYTQQGHTTEFDTLLKQLPLEWKQGCSSFRVFLFWGRR